MDALGLAVGAAAVLVILLITQFMTLRRAASKLPPGPTPLPILGNLWALNFTLHHETLMQLTKRYGNTFTVWIGHSPMVVVHGYEAVMDALVTSSDVMNNRPLTPSLKDYAKDKGVTFSNGNTWKQQKRFCTMVLRNLGTGKKTLEQRIQVEARHLVEGFAAQQGTPSDPSSLIGGCVANVISSLAFGHRFDINDSSFHHLIEDSNYITYFLGSNWSQVHNAFPWVSRNFLGPYKKLIAHVERINSYVKKEIKEHREKPGGELQDLIDFYLDQMSKNKGEGEKESIFDDANLFQLVIDLFIAGSETVATVLMWCLLYMIKYPDIQDKVQKELDCVLHDSQTIRYEDNQKLPYTKAVIHEIHRHCLVVALGVPHQCTESTTIQGFNIEKGTVILANLASVMYDPKHWEKPQQFNPSNFLDQDGKFVNRKAFLPFSAGQRMCLGSQMARTELFLFFSNLLREFRFQLPDAGAKINVGYVCGLTLKPHPCQISALVRRPATSVNTGTFKKEREADICRNKQ
ncbi:cytochrome P450 2J2-like [Lissotriton helveticus]